MQLACYITSYPNGLLTLRFPVRGGAVPHGNFKEAMLEFKKRIGLDWIPLHDRERRVWVILPKHGKDARRVKYDIECSFKSWGVQLSTYMDERPKSIDWPESRLS